MLNFLRPLTTGDVWWQDGQIKEEEEDLFSRNRLFLLGLAKILAKNRLNFQIIRIFTAFLLKQAKNNF
jgi:hypothetical protein